MRKFFEIYRVNRRYVLYVAVIVNGDELVMQTFASPPVHVVCQDFVLDDFVFNQFWDRMYKCPDSMYFKGNVNLSLMMIKEYYQVLKEIYRYDFCPF